MAVFSYRVEPAKAALFIEPPVLSSTNGRLSVLLVASEHTQRSLIGPSGEDFSAVKFWTYQVCSLPKPTLVAAPAVPSCPASTPSFTNLGGVRFALTAGDTFRVRLVNQLPRVRGTDLTHYTDYPPLTFNPTNIHAHGFIVDPHDANNSSTDPYGDYALLELPPANIHYTSTNPHGTIINNCNNYVDYLYVLEPNHPSGLYWLHPHLHGISLNQVSAGLSEIVTVGSPADYCPPGDAACTTAIQNATIRHLVLKDTQVLGNGALQTQEQPTFCGLVTTITSNLGSCPQDPATITAPNTKAGAWLHTVSGQIYPTINVGANGDVWEIINSSGSRDYWLTLGEPSGAGGPASVPMQVLAIDGVTIKIKASETARMVTSLTANRLVTAPCPGLAMTTDMPVCASKIRMMPSSRVAVRVLRTDAGAMPLNLKLYTALFNTGRADYSTGDQWPAIGLAAVALASKNPAAAATIATRDVTATIVSATGQPQSAPLIRTSGTTTLTAASSQPAASVLARTSPPPCPAVPAGGHRRIKFAYPTDTTFGLGVEVVDANNNVVSASPIQQFDINRTDVCVPISNAGQTYEVWELQNLTPEDHNFHIHQTRFLVVNGAVSPGYSIPQLLNGNVVLHDNIPLPRATQAGCSGVLSPSNSPNTPSLCVPHSTWVVIPFQRAGDFVFHCHILEHEDGGMMGKVHVQASLP